MLCQKLTQNYLGSLRLMHGRKIDLYYFLRRIFLECAYALFQKAGLIDLGVCTHLTCVNMSHLAQAWDRYLTRAQNNNLERLRD